MPPTSPWKLSRKCSAQGIATKYAKQAPAAKKIGVISRNGKKAFFSFAYNPGATNRHSCVASTGKLSMNAAKSETFTCVKNASNMSV